TNSCAEPEKQTWSTILESAIDTAVLLTAAKDGQLEVLKPKATQAVPATHGQFKTEEMTSGSRFRVVPQGFAHLVHQRIARERLLQEETIILLEDIIGEPQMLRRSIVGSR